MNLSTNGARTALAVIVAATLLAACGGGGGGSAVSPGSTSANASAQGKIALSITVPKKSASSTVRRSAYVSASTQSLALTIKQNTTVVQQQAIGLTPATNPNCSSTGGATTCSSTIGLAAGNYTGTFTTYDGPLVSGAATGNVLSQGTGIAITVTAGATNSVPVTMDGVPASITIAPASGATVTGTQGAGFSVPYSAQPMLVQALDAGNNIIVGAGAPTFTATVTAAKFAVTQPVPGTPNQITVAAVQGGSGTISVTAAAANGGFSCRDPGVVCTASATVATPPHQLFVLNQASFSVYSSLDNVTWTRTANQSISGPAFLGGITVAADGTLFVGYQGIFSRLITAYAPPYNGTGTSLSTVQQPSGLTTAAAQLFVTDQYHLHVYASPYTSTPASVNFPQSAVANGLVTDSANDAIVSTFAGTWLFSAPSYTSITTILPSSGGPMAIDRSGTLYIGNQNNSDVYIVPAPYTGTSVTMTLPGEGGMELPQAVALDANGNLWVNATYSGSCPCNNYVFEFAPPFTSSSTPSFSQITSSKPMAADSSGNMIVATNSSTLTILGGSGTTVGTITDMINSPVSVYYLR